ncbi:MAG: SCO family protein [Luminiphilus sp.]|nr:SCO family protein [Luminiphilus sp.]MDG2036934.1 SCO family protein [Luminiphilus sp.]
MRGTLFLLIWAWSAAALGAPHQHKPPVVLAPGYAPLEFIAPEPGSYGLPTMGVAADGEVLDSDGNKVRLHDFIGDKPTVLSFIFTTCDDVNGCPLATYVMRNVQDALQADPLTANKARLVSFSFDPLFDTPGVIDAYGAQFRADGFDWQFLTTEGATTLDPILSAYDQWVIRDYDTNGEYMGTMSHILRVFLIDESRRIRNIYSTSFLHADTVANDVRSLLIEAQAHSNTTTEPGH